MKVSDTGFLSLCRIHYLGKRVNILIQSIEIRISKYLLWRKNRKGSNSFSFIPCNTASVQWETIPPRAYTKHSKAIPLGSYTRPPLNPRRPKKAPERESQMILLPSLIFPKEDMCSIGKPYPHLTKHLVATYPRPLLAQPLASIRAPESESQMIPFPFFLIVHQEDTRPMGNHIPTYPKHSLEANHLVATYPPPFFCSTSGVQYEHQKGPEARATPFCFCFPGATVFKCTDMAAIRGCNPHSVYLEAAMMFVPDDTLSIFFYYFPLGVAVPSDCNLSLHFHHMIKSMFRFVFIAAQNEVVFYIYASTASYVSDVLIILPSIYRASSD
ncbi:hypothetical protein CEXT_543051 [Caerostris extrusa]|uniref:Uncharacterized protein n=1 Tax=Caerostris extrusa TaxID=172846 RepID=A0AAV4PY44_CAEEX|nr:hypothetical protein CEXT_543051 [Caerostris extrusa]